MDSDPQKSTIYLKDYQPYPHKLQKTWLEFHLDPEKTIVKTRLEFYSDKDEDLVLDGEELQLISIAINGEELTFGDLSFHDGQLIIAHDAIPHGEFTLETEVEIAPAKNTALSGLYISGGMYCTQCEAEGFRRITYYPDRPDVMSEFHVTIYSDEPVRLSNGNVIETGENVSIWHDPFLKPAYLFALVAGDLVHKSDQFQAKDGRDIELKIFVRDGDLARVDYAMDALKRSMRWDEEVYGRIYDLDLFMIVAVDDFNMGAMENKGLNIFNSSLVLASPETATDEDYAAIESVIAHEYFHNWTGNRITCRDWFQLSLKEGLTVFRDQQFSSDERSQPVQRIEDVRRLRNMQFPEDQGPLSHAVRPESYQAIDNFYTATIYEKGAELIGMMKTLVGDENYQKALDLYFERHDGQACTIEDWLQVFTDVSKRDLSQFKLWYKQSGTPKITAKTEQNAEKFIAKIRQSFDEAHQKNKAMHIPLRYSLYNAQGTLLDQNILELTEWEQSLEWDLSKFDIHQYESAEHNQLFLSLNQNFSAPVILEQIPNPAQHIFAYDQDPFNRWEAGQYLALQAFSTENERAVFLENMGIQLENSALDPALLAQILTLPSDSDVLSYYQQNHIPVHMMSIVNARKSLSQNLGERYFDKFQELYNKHSQAQSLAPQDAASRSLAACALYYMTAAKGDGQWAQAHFDKARLMSDKTAALRVLIAHGQAENALAAFYEEFQSVRLVVDKYFAMQARLTPYEDAARVMDSLEKHQDFADANPNRLRAVYGGFAMGNLPAFHAEDGSGYARLAKAILSIDAKNPQIAARLVGAFQSYKYFDERQQKLAKATLNQLIEEKLSVNSYEMITRLLGE